MTSLPDQFQPFPVELLPDPMGRFVADASAAIGCDPVYLALPLLSAAAGAIGNSRAIGLKSGWQEPSILWTVIIGESGSLKSPALEAVLRPLHLLQDREYRRFEQRLGRYRRREQHHRRDLGAWSGGSNARGLPRTPREPNARRYVVNDVTIPAIVRIHRHNPRGLLLARDELSGWFQSFGKGDAAYWCEMHGARPLVVDRGAGKERILHIPNASVSVTGGTQPGVLARMLGRDLFEGGLVPRLLLAAPSVHPKTWTESELSPERQNEMLALFEGLLGLVPASTSRRACTPRVLPMAPRAKDAWIEFYTEFAEEAHSVSGDLAAAYSKLEGQAARLALVVHCVRRVSAGSTASSDEVVDRSSVDVGVELARWFAFETRRVYALLNEDDQARARRRAVESVRQMGGSASVRAWQKKGAFATADEARSDLEALAAAGFGVLERRATGSRGRPSEVFTLQG